MKTKQKILKIFRGPPGSGKTYTCNKLAPAENIFSTDDFWLIDGKYIFDSSKLSKAHEWNIERVNHAMQQNLTPILIANTNIKIRDFKPYVELAKAHGYEVSYNLPDSPWFVEIYPRIVNKTFTDQDVFTFVEKTVHSVPFEAIKRMMDRWEEII